MIADRYTLDREIGRGGMGAVWLGRDELLGRKVALKRIGMPPPGSAQNPEAAQAQREAKLAASLSDPHVVSVFDLAPDGDDQWLVMEYVEGTDLAAMIRDRGALSPDEAAPILAQVADALIAAHRAGVVHRDVKPSNILVTPEGQVKLSDFGIARTLGDPSLTQTGLVTGSPAYLSPEVASGRSATAASDVWSLGATAYHLLEGRPPYELGDNLLGALYRIVHEDPPRPSASGWLAPLFAATMTDEELRWDATQVREFLIGGPRVIAPAPPRPRPRRGVRPDRGPRADAVAGGTRVLQAVRQVEEDDDPSAHPAPDRNRLIWALCALAVLAVVLLSFVLVRALGSGDDSPVDNSDVAADPSTATSAPPSPAPSPSTTPTATAEGITTFIEDYLALAPRDQTASVQELTAAFRQASPDYATFWRSVRNVEVQSIDPDPDNLTVTYVYTYRRAGEARRDRVTLRLEFVDGNYLIAGES